ncbi:MAG: sulfatase-like hydrolase/transferase [Planctomycetes bacterium]|nr:sulfatase-like hydrolase/transferase [Planctomycetota bacterium]
MKNHREQNSGLNRRDLVKSAATVGLAFTTGVQGTPQTAAAAPTGANPIRQENAKRGTRDWLLNKSKFLSVGSWAAIGQNVFQRAAMVALTALVFALLSSPYAVQGQTDRPNVLILFADDLGHGDVSYNGGDIPTPNIDALVADGVRLTSGYMTAPVCNPSRAGLITGRYQQRWGQELNTQTEPPSGSAKRGALPPVEQTIGSLMKKAGYATGVIGKWQLGVDDGYHPLDRGFDEFFGFAKVSNFINPDWPGVHEASSRGRSPGPRLLRGREPATLDMLLTEQLAREGIDFIERHKDEPFFLYLPFYAPHVPLETMNKYYQRFPQFENETKRVYAAMISALDDAIGAVLEKLRENGLDEKTLVIFTSDNGAAEYIDTDGARNKPLIGHKRNLYEGGIRVPFAMRWKGHLPSGAVYRSPVSSLDILPTALGASNASVPSNVDGVNLLPFLRGERQGDPHEYLFWRSGPNAAVRKGKWKLFLSDSIERLYDVQTDPGESNDRASADPAVASELREAFRKWNAQLPNPRRATRKVTTQFNGDKVEWDI